MEKKHSSKAIWILSPSTTMPCSFKGTNIEALHNPTIETNIMSEFLAKTLLAKMPLVPTNKLFKSPSGLIFECCGIARAVPIIIDKTKVHLDFHVFAILEFNLLIGYPCEKILQKQLGSLNEEFGKTASATHSEIPMAKQHPNHDQFEEVKFISSFVSHPYEAEHPSSPLLEHKPCPSTHLNENFYAMDISKAALGIKKKDPIVEHESFSLETPQVSCSLSESPELILFSTKCSY